MQFNDNNNYFDVTVRDRIRFLVFASWWTVLFCSLYGLLFVRSSIGLLLSVMSHGVL